MRIKVRYSGKALIIFLLGVIGVWTIISAQKWPLKSALFPLVIGSLTFLMAIAELFFVLFGKEEKEEEPTVIDFTLHKGTEQKLANRRTISIFLWMLGFFALILLIGFPLATLLFIFLYLKLEAKQGWLISFGITAAICTCFFMVYVWLLENPFLEGWIYEGLRRRDF